MLLAIFSGCIETGLVSSDAPPTTMIVSPDDDGVAFAPCESILITGTFGDAETAPDRITLSWLVDGGPVEGRRQGQRASIGFDAGALDPTLTHDVSLTVTDSAGQVATDTRSFTAPADAPPDLWILSPANAESYDPNAVIDVLVDAADADEGAGGELRLTFLLDGTEAAADVPVDDDGRARFSTLASTLGSGAHTVEVRAIDGCGEYAVDSVDFSITGELPGADVDEVEQASGEAGGDGGVIHDVGDTVIDDGSICASMMGTSDGQVPVFLGSCDTTAGFTAYDGHCYYPVTTRTTLWADARASCAAAGGYLAVPTDAGEAAFVYDLAGRAYAGGCDGDTEGTWTWITGETWAWTDFGPGEPNDSSTGEDCLEVTARTGAWNDIWCTYVAFGEGYVCEFEP